MRESKRWRRVPWLLLAAAATLVLVGWWGIARTESLVLRGAGHVPRQAVFSALALVVLCAAAVPSYRAICRFSYAAFAVSLLLLMAVYFFPSVNGAQRWIRLGPVGGQPSELAKIAFVLALARYLMYRTDQRRMRGLVVPMLLTLVPILLILKEPDLGTALVFLPVMLAMVFVAGARTADLAWGVLWGALCVPLLWTQMNTEQRSRVTALWEQTAPEERPTDDGYQLARAKQMMALGSVLGSFAAGESRNEQVAHHLPEAHTDFIFPVLGERFGLWGTGGVLMLYCVLIWRGAAVAWSTQEPFARLVATGLVGLIGVQALVNTAMTVGLAPVTGLSLPLVSYGGSGLLSSGLALGLLTNIAMRPGYEVAGEPFRYAVDR